MSVNWLLHSLQRGASSSGSHVGNDETGDAGERAKNIISSWQREHFHAREVCVRERVTCARVYIAVGESVCLCISAT